MNEEKKWNGGASMEKCHNLPTNRGAKKGEKKFKVFRDRGTRINFSTNQIRNTHLWKREKKQKNAWQPAKIDFSLYLQLVFPLRFLHQRNSILYSQTNRNELRKCSHFKLSDFIANHSKSKVSSCIIYDKMFFFWTYNFDSWRGRAVHSILKWSFLKVCLQLWLEVIYFAAINFN